MAACFVRLIRCVATERETHKEPVLWPSHAAAFDHGAQSQFLAADPIQRASTASPQDTLAADDRDHRQATQSERDEDE